MSNDPPTSDRIRSDIDSGRTGEKVDFPDPAAAPLGSDAEAGGAPPTSTQREMETAARPEHRPERDIPGLTLYAIFAGVAGILILAAAIVAS